MFFVCLRWNYAFDAFRSEIFYNKCSSKRIVFPYIIQQSVAVRFDIDDNFIQCEKCRKRFYRKRKDQIYCDKCTGYHKQSIKTVVCCDCGKEFEIKSNSRKIRCDNCYRLERQEHNKKMYRNRSKI